MLGQTRSYGCLVGLDVSLATNLAQPDSTQNHR